MLRKVLVALASALIFCLVLAWANYTPAGEREEGVYHWSYGSLVAIYLIYALPVYLLGGIPFAYLIEFAERKTGWKHPLAVYLFRFFAYALAGCFVMGLFVVVVSNGRSLSNAFASGGLLLLGGGAALLYGHVLLFSFWLVKRRKEWG
ncbi:MULTISPECIES: hypothetical protein [Brevibacillus]|uniref:hypothetical protein n=1 Tax=Brevibacillus TaxID=55080 RepID=UPI00041E9436|nr:MULTISPECIES: hypothetical protein [Brevibacillus]MBY0054374.1 hypothetical protein [Brevibacillus agri]MCG5251684.1 hypothetical protein [Brevibacillus agri]MDR9505916.1 hypothetical protein [Brevibacillus agri]MED1825377.1 hypothetical protein [Brevibacillus agri]MED3501385.1 hypothetical protein [Brevibacillus agri]